MALIAPPTDLDLTKAIYELYFDEFIAYDEEQPTRLSKNYVPLDIRRIARHLGTDAELVFGSLYYTLDEKLKIPPSGGRYGAGVPFFMKKRQGFLNGDDVEEMHCVHFPMLASYYASLRHENSKANIAIGISIVSALIALVALVFK